MIYNVELKRTFRVTTVVFWLKMGNLKKLREKKKLSQGQLSIRSGVNLQTIKAYEQRTRNINHAQGDILNRLANALDCAIEDLLEDDKPCARCGYRDFHH